MSDCFSAYGGGSQLETGAFSITSPYRSTKGFGTYCPTLTAAVGPRHLRRVRTVIKRYCRHGFEVRRRPSARGLSQPKRKRSVLLPADGLIRPSKRHMIYARYKIVEKAPERATSSLRKVERIYHNSHGGRESSHKISRRQISTMSRTRLVKQASSRSIVARIERRGSTSGLTME